MTRPLAVDLTAPSVSYPVTAQGTLVTLSGPPKVGVYVAVVQTEGSAHSEVHSHSATGLPSGLNIDIAEGVLFGVPDTANPSPASATVTVIDTAGNRIDVPITFPAVAKGDQTLTGFSYSPRTVAFGDTAPTVTEPSGVRTSLSYSATPSDVCTVDSSTGALTLLAGGECEVTATAEGTTNYNRATATVTVTTVQPAGPSG